MSRNKLTMNNTDVRHFHTKWLIPLGCKWFLLYNQVPNIYSRISKMSLYANHQICLKFLIWPWIIGFTEFRKKCAPLDENQSRRASNTGPVYSTSLSGNDTSLDSLNLSFPVKFFLTWMTFPFEDDVTNGLDGTRCKKSFCTICTRYILVVFFYHLHRSANSLWNTICPHSLPIVQISLSNWMFQQKQHESSWCKLLTIWYFERNIVG